MTARAGLQRGISTRFGLICQGHLFGKILIMLRNMAILWHTPFTTTEIAVRRNGNRALKEIEIVSDTTMTFLGTSGVFPEDDSDSSSLLIGNKYLFDTGGCAPVTMLRFGFSPLDIDYVFMSHFRQDHYLGLVQLLFYAAMNKAKYLKRTPFKIVGPVEDIQRVMDLALMHCRNELIPAALISAKKIFPNTSFPNPGDAITVS
jgi:hypothetical protein